MVNTEQFNLLDNFKMMVSNVQVNDGCSFFAKMNLHDMKVSWVEHDMV